MWLPSPAAALLAGCRPGTPCLAALAVRLTMCGPGGGPPLAPCHPLCAQADFSGCATQTAEALGGYSTTLDMLINTMAPQVCPQAWATGPYSPPCILLRGFLWGR